ncbi:hypothetical protein VPNG_07259 [Cytospora leucostoma]|uniref:Uncharacterized protein n=1 Tax=Cytospora leucostoma TaxID=1230097 RepID=A0A423WKD4_9PEZI|nr:hypothetical protein VPNG_07259 [Cytospora leucostoma]
MPWRWWRNKTSHHEKAQPPPYDTLNPMPSLIHTNISITYTRYNLEVDLIITDVCSNIAAGARIHTGHQLLYSVCEITVDIADKIAIAFAGAVKPDVGSRDAAARASASIARAISKYEYHGAFTAAEVAVRIVAAINAQVAAAARKRRYEDLDSWNCIIRAARVTVCSISKATDPGVAAAGVASAFQGLM